MEMDLFLQGVSIACYAELCDSYDQVVCLSALTVLELLPLTPILGGHVTLAMPLFEKFLGVMSGLSLETYASNLKSIALTILELLAFNAQKFRRSRDLGHASFLKNF